jgi:hypothetical protein
VSRRFLPPTLLALLVACGSDGGPTGGDAGPMDAGGPEDRCSREAPCSLTLDVRDQEIIAPVQDVDRFTFDAASGDIVNVLVENPVPRSAVSLRAVLFDPTLSSVATGQNQMAPSQPQRVVIQHVVRTAGTFSVDVSDVGNDDADDRNPYFITVSVLPQEDPFEPNDGPSEAAAISLPTTISGGRIASQGDVDWFSFTLADGDVLRILPTGAGQESEIRFRWTVFQAAAPDRPLFSSEERFVLQDPSDVDSGVWIWPEERRAIGLQGGSYLLQVTPVDAGDASLDAVSTIELSVATDPDPNEVSPNETPSTATPLTLGTPVTGFIASTSDADYYAFEVTGASEANPKVMSVALERTGDATLTVQPQFVIERVLNLGQENEDTRELFCNQGNACLARRTLNDGTRPERVVSCHDDQFCRTAHPFRENGTFYVLVRDLQDDEFDIDSSYRLTVDEVDTSVDAREDFDSSRDRAQMVPLTTSTSAPILVFEEVRGYISYVGDEDWYRFEIPTEGFDGNPDQNGDWEFNIEFDVDGPSEIEYAVRVDLPGGGDNEIDTFVQSNGGRCPREAPSTPEVPDPLNCDNAANSHAFNDGPLAPDPSCFLLLRENAGNGVYRVRVRDAANKRGTPLGDDFDVSPAAEYRLRLRFQGRCRADSSCLSNSANQAFCPRD